MNALSLQYRLVVAMVVTAMFAATMAFLATPASAAVPGLTIETASSATDSNDHKGAEAICPAGTVAIGSGATVEGGLGQVAIQSVVPASDRVIAGAYEDANGTNNLWSVNAQAICANQPPGHLIVYSTSPQTAANKSEPVSCPGNLVTIGSGGLLSGSFGDVRLDVQPRATGVTAIGTEIGAGTAVPWSVVAYASCADPGLPGLVLASASSANTAANKSLTVSCPGSTEVLTAAGSIPNGGGRALVDDFYADRDTVTATGKETGNGTANPWRVKAMAICATP